MHPAERHARKLLKERGYVESFQAGVGNDPEHGEIVLFLPSVPLLVLRYNYKFNGGHPMWFVTTSPPSEQGWPPFPMPNPSPLEELARSQVEE
jgi:hypothetical protein